MVFRKCDVGLALSWVVEGERFIDDLRGGAGEAQDLSGKLCYVVLLRIAQIHRPKKLSWGIHQSNDPIQKIVDEAKRASLRPLSIDSNRLIFERLDDEVRNDSAIIRMHSRPIGIEDARHFNGDLVLAMEVEKERLGAPFPLIVTRSDANRVYIAPVGLFLRVRVGISIDFARRGLEDFGIEPSCKLKEVESAQNACLHRLDRIVLIVGRGGGAGEIVDLIDLDLERKGDVVPDHFKVGVIFEVGDIVPTSRVEIVETEYLMPFSQEKIAKVRAQKTGAARH